MNVRLPILIASLLLLSSSLPSPARAASDTSLGIVCPEDVTVFDGGLCARFRIESTWTCSGSTCALDIEMTLTAPAGDCSTSRLEVYAGISVCGLANTFDLTDTYSFVGFEEGATKAFGATLCLGDSAPEPEERSVECAHWTHQTSPAPWQGAPEEEDVEEVLGGVEEALWWQSFGLSGCPDVDACGLYTPVVGVGTREALS